jgi:microcystin-dependent protein
MSTGIVKSAKMETGDLTTKNISTDGTITSTDKITTKELESREVLKGQKICIDDVCLEKDGLKRLIELKMPEPKLEFKSGMILAWKGSENEVPKGWLLCNGENGTPNLRGRFILGSGKGTGLTSRSVGSTGGAENALINHRHLISYSNSANNKKFRKEGIHVIRAPRGNEKGARKGNPEYDGEAEGVGKKYGENAFMFSGQPRKINNNKHEEVTTNDSMPPYYVLAYIMKK